MKIKVLLDIVMTVIMVSLLNTNITGMALHEVLGIAVFVLFFVHKVLNFKWIKTVTGNLFKKSVNPKTRMMYALDVLLLILATLNVLTGILISTCILTEFSADDVLTTSQLHHILAYLLLAALLVHIGLHWAYLRKSMKIPKGGWAEKFTIAAIATALVLTLLDSYTIRNLLPPRKEEDPYYQEETIGTEQPEPTGPVGTEPPDPTEEESDPTEPETTDPPDPTEPTETEPQSPTEPEGNEEEPTEPETEPPTEPATEPIPTLEEYLSKLRCTACGRRCLLTNPACGRGRTKQQSAIEEYNQTYNVG